ncbi:Hypothetical predicted protein [Lecanosticta acicola]|uniref:Uncharacterized protein n=1 Tax=Lecanosticta acicola TaxID=111012 RepID=A0AAI8Z8Q1_9PEZI|nr:Hypothetical predicted protein [Lecanosticta acicola]
MNNSRRGPKGPTFKCCHAACTRRFKETNEGRIQVEESEAVMDLVLKSFYEQTIQFFNPEFDSKAWFKIAAAEPDKSWNDAVMLMTDLAERAKNEFGSYFVEVSSPVSLVKFGIQLFQPDLKSDKKMHEIAARQIGARMGEITRDPAAWKVVYSNEELSQSALTDLIAPSAWRRPASECNMPSGEAIERDIGNEVFCRIVFRLARSTSAKMCQ